ncbi:hypothetical protein OX283_006120 [Flavobacterium sp. SUN052]|uniref:hypothetical protein n=1 Tax=Flavobacterium sp. SUN052 TaxID=3002441 RepID=UPI00237D9643|nr:hypothetical protein [Flavobacterium sp. SUN052]MEC4004223.1 hypothetical protein [Flavobacterium sp. SUN052]
MIKKVFLSLIVVTTILSCSSSDSTDNSNGSGTGTETTVAMVTRIDNVVYDTPPQNGGNLAENSGGTSFGGTSYYLLKGYKNFGSSKIIAKIGSKVINIYLAIPKNDLSVGTHSFSSTFISGDYYADIDISGVVPSENANTTSGFIKITNYDSTTKLLKGNFNFTTNDGVDVAVTSHTLIGSFTYKLP